MNLEIRPLPYYIKSSYSPNSLTARKSDSVYCRGWTKETYSIGIWIFISVDHCLTLWKRIFSEIQSNGPSYTSSLLFSVSSNLLRKSHYCFRQEFWHNRLGTTGILEECPTPQKMIKIWGLQLTLNL